MMEYVFLPLDNAFVDATAVPGGYAGHLMLLLNMHYCIALDCHTDACQAQMHSKKHMLMH